MDIHTPLHIKTISEYHRLVNLPKPQHPLISLSRFEDIQYRPGQSPHAIVHNFYSIALKKSFHAKLRYGQQEVDFDEGTLLFMAPMQVISADIVPGETLSHTGWLLLVHPDLLWHTDLARKIKQYEYFSYKVNEALHLSDDEEQMIVGIMQSIAQEYKARIDNHSQDVIVAQLELLLTYAERFYQRQFITRRASSHYIVDQLEELLNTYFKSGELPLSGMPTVTYIADALNLSPNYLSRLLKTLTGQSTKQFIVEKVVDLAKEKLSTTDLSMNEIAYALGFEHPQSFNKLFKSKTSMSPLQFRHSFN
jgi:AraC-like DNA-binding protein